MIKIKGNAFYSSMVVVEETLTGLKQSKLAKTRVKARNAGKAVFVFTTRYVVQMGKHIPTNVS